MILLIILIQGIYCPEIVNAQSPIVTFKKAVVDTSESTINLVISTMGANSYVGGLRVPKGTGSIGVVSSTAYNNGAIRGFDSSFVSQPAVSSDMATVSDQSGIFFVYSKDQNNGDISLYKKDASANVLWSTILTNVSGSGHDNPISLRILGNNLFLSGSCFSSDRIPAQGQNAFVTKLDLLGVPTWTRFFNGFAATSVAPTIAGNSFVLVRGYDPSWNIVQTVYCLDAFGSTLWSSALPLGYTATDICFGERENSLFVGLKEDVATSLISFVSVDLLGNVSAVFQTTQSGSIVQMEDSYAGFVVAGTFTNLITTTTGAYGAEYSSNFDRIWVRKETTNSTGAYVFTGLAQRSASIGWVFVGMRTRPYLPSSTYDMILTRVTYPAPSATVAILGSTAICPGQNVTLSVPYDSNATYVWKKYGNVIAGATGNSLVVTAIGNYKVMVTNKYGVIRTSAVVNITLGASCRLSVDETQEEIIDNAEVRTEAFQDDMGDIKIYPNPTTDHLVIEKIKVGDIITVIDPLGKVVIEQSAVAIEEVIDVSKIKPGFYFVVVGHKTKRFIKE